MWKFVFVMLNILMYVCTRKSPICICCWEISLQSWVSALIIDEHVPGMLSRTHMTKWWPTKCLDMLLIQRGLHCSDSREGSYCSGETAAGWVLLQEQHKYRLEHLISAPLCSQISTKNNHIIHGALVDVQGCSSSSETSPCELLCVQ